MLSLFDSGPPPPCPAPFNLTSYVLAAGQAMPEKPALAIVAPTGTDFWSYAELRQAVLGTASGLRELGLAPGSHVLLRLPNCVEFPIAFLGSIAAGLIPVPTSALLTVPEIGRIAGAVGPALIIAGKGVALPEAANCPVIAASELAGMYELPPSETIMGDPERLAYIISTSGTSGRPRLVMHSHRSIWARRMMQKDWYDLSDSDRLLHAGAFNWTYTLGTGLLDPWTIGATALVPAPSVKPWQLPDLLRRHDATIFAAAPGVYRQILKSGIPKLPNLRHGLSAGEKLPDVTRDAWEKATGTLVHEALGMSECSTFISSRPACAAPAGTVGFPQRGRCIAVLDEGVPVEVDTAGTLAISLRDPGMMLGYLGDSPAMDVRTLGSWFLTDDIVSMRADGAITYHGRMDDMINAGGFRISPIEIEAVLHAHPRIVECAAAEVRVRSDTTLVACFYVAETEIDCAELSDFAPHFHSEVQLRPFPLS